MRVYLHHITEELLTAYVDEVERLLSEGETERVIINVPIAVEMVDGKYAKIIAPSNQDIVDCLNEDFEVDDELNFIIWEGKK